MVLSEGERGALEELVRAHSTAQQLALRARVILRLAAGFSDRQVGRQLGVGREMVKRWRERWGETAGRELKTAERLVDAPRPGAPPKITPEQHCALIALACTDPKECGREITHWTPADLADEMMKKGALRASRPGR